MYKLIIKTKYNTIELETDDLQKPEIQEILSQPYIEEVKVEKISLLSDEIKNLSYEFEKVQERILKYDTRRKGTE